MAFGVVDERGQFVGSGGGQQLVRMGAGFGEGPVAPGLAAPGDEPAGPVALDAFCGGEVGAVCGWQGSGGPEVTAGEPFEVHWMAFPSKVAVASGLPRR